MIDYLLPVGVLAAAGLVFVSMVVIDRVRERYRDPGRPFVVYDARTFGYAPRRIRILLGRGDERSDLLATAIMISARNWLRSEIHTGRRSRRPRRAAQLEQLELQMEQAGFCLIGR